ncbi:DUF5658 family protein [Alkaliphilus transvaalensis]|uniref:DUF5658 family protein n=1 Tax=Alkaliphilus transvaalensis TaxID=114628 RepID=UPI000558FD09|nr:DUF5658 family protein [Alkaliphilus transvaalensis]
MTNKQYYFLVFLLAGIGLFNIADYFLTLEVVGQGHQEANPIINAILYTPYFSIVKLLVVPLLLLLIAIVGRRLPKRCLFYTGATFLVYFVLMVYFKVVFF